MVKEHRLGQMELNMKVNGVMVWQKDKVHFIMQMVTYTKEIFREIELMVLVYTNMLTDNAMKVTGLMICKKVKGQKNLRMVQFTRVNLKMEKNGV